MKRLLLAVIACLIVGGAIIALADIYYSDPVVALGTDGGWDYYEINWTPFTPVAPTGFTFTVNTAVSGTSSTNQFTICHYTNDPAAYDYVVYYDGTNTAWNSTNDLTLTFPSGPGVYDITISNTFGGLANGGIAVDRNKIIRIKTWGNQTRWVSGYGSFLSVTNLSITATDVPDLSLAKSCYQMFRTADGHAWTNVVVSNWNVSAVTDFTEMWRGFDVGTVYPIFHGFETWDVSNAKSLVGMFYFGRGQTDWSQLANWDVSKVQDMSFLFYRNYLLTNIDLSRWNVGNCTFMRGMCSDLSVITSLDLPWSNLTASVTNFNEFCASSPLLTNVTGIGSWTVTNIASASLMFSSSTLNTTNYSDLLIGWGAQAVKTNVVFHGGSSKYLAGDAATARTNLVTNYGWTITDGGLAP